MLKRHGSSVVLKRHRSSVELLPHDLVKLILERLPVKSLVRFKSLSKMWKSTIESRRFQEGHLMHRMKSRGPDVLAVYVSVYGDDWLNTDALSIAVGSSIVSTVSFLASGSMICHGSCDGLLCLYCVYTPSVVVNPATNWHQSFPLSSIQPILIDRFTKGMVGSPHPRLGFGKDKFTGTYKPVWLYNSSGFGLDNVTTCEVFDFRTNAWRYVVPASPYRILAHQYPVYLDGSLYWFTECKETKLLSFDIHTETFQVISMAPFSHLRDPRNVVRSQ